jgi:heme-degrading monooxygenase HmoA
MVFNANVRQPHNGGSSMYARMLSVRLAPGCERDHVNTGYEDIVSLLRKQNGFRGSVLLLDEDARTAVVMTYWLDEECAGEAGEVALPALYSHMAGITDWPPEITGYQVLDHHISSSV